MTIRAGLIGFGLAGRYFHASLIRAAGMQVAAVVTRRKEAVHEYLGNDVAVLNSVEELFARDDIDLIAIASPSPLHAPHAAAALRAGKHVVVDKPVSATAAECSDLAQLAKQHGRKLSVFQNRRWDADFLTIKKLIDAGKLGEITSYYSRWDRFRPQVVERWQENDVPGQGLVYDLGTHLIDQVLVLFGEPEWLYANTFTQRENSKIVDGFEILMGKGKLRISVGVSLMTCDGGFRYRVNGTRASFLKPGLDPQEAQSRAGMEPNDASYGVEPREQWGFLVEGENGSRQVISSERGRWLTFYERMRRAIEHDEPVPVPAEEACATIRIIEAALTSSSMGCRIDLQPAPPPVSR
ncbi:MAG: Gfo/Idh/MocA family oxidoreductase [Steroidobacter sp.]